MGSRRTLPIGIQTFRTIREEGCYYVDKTPYAGRLIEEGSHYLPCRSRDDTRTTPRRNGRLVGYERIVGHVKLTRESARHDQCD